MLLCTVAVQAPIHPNFWCLGSSPRTAGAAWQCAHADGQGRNVSVHPWEAARPALPGSRASLQVAVVISRPPKGMPGLACHTGHHTRRKAQAPACTRNRHQYPGLDTCCALTGGLIWRPKGGSERLRQAHVASNRPLPWPHAGRPKQRIREAPALWTRQIRDANRPAVVVSNAQKPTGALAAAAAPIGAPPPRTADNGCPWLAALPRELWLHPNLMR